MNLAPNGKPSNLTPEQYRLVRTPAFKEFFGDWENSPKTASKVVDENGEPMVAYHGTDEKFNEFLHKVINTTANYYDILGFYFTLIKPPKKSGYGGIIKSCFLNIRKQILVANKMVEKNPTWETKPLTKKQILSFIENIEPVYDDYSKEKIIEILVNIEDLNRQLLFIYNQFFSKWKLKDGIKLFLENITDKLGYDGAYMPHSEYVVAFHPNQIKLADGSNTTFNASSYDIRYEIGGATKAFNYTIGGL